MGNVKGIFYEWIKCVDGGRKVKKLILYGAGKRGNKVAELFKEKNISIEGFLDSNKKEYGGGIKY